LDFVKENGEKLVLKPQILFRNVKMCKIVIFMLICYLLQTANAFSEHGYHPQFTSDKSDKEVLDILTHDSRYDKRSKPPQQQIHVNISVLLLSLSSPSESSLTYEIEFLMHQKWIDFRLAHNHSDGRKKPLYGLSHHNKIWKPDIFLVKHGSYKVEPRI